jgi:DNA sulfur modification protein DndC
MKYEQTNMFAGSKRLQMNESIELTIQSIMAYAHKYKHWCIAWSGGKDSTTLLTLVVWLIDSGRVQKPDTLTVMYADTRLELTPLYFAAQEIIAELKEIGIEVRVVMAPLNKRFMTYILGRGVPPPNNNTFRWCTRQIKIDPMKAELEKLFREKGEKVLMLTGVRQGESAIRDQRIIMSCGKDGAECGQGWYQETMPESICDTLAPLLHWRVCHVWEWLKHWAPLPEYGDFTTALIADAYGGDEAEEINTRTGCVACPLASKDTALENLIKRLAWGYLAPLLKLKPIWRRLRLPQNRLRKTGLELSGDKNKQRMGPLTISARKDAYNDIIRLQNEINKVAIQDGKPTVTLLNRQERLLIKSLWKINKWPNKWTGDEPTADTPMDTVYSDGSVQPLIQFGE